MGYSAQDFIKDFSDFTSANYIRLASTNVEVTKAVVKALFGDVTYLSRKNEPENELAFVTGVMTEKGYYCTQSRRFPTAQTFSERILCSGLLMFQLITH